MRANTKEIFNSDAETFGGSGAVNPRVKFSREKEWDERKEFHQGKDTAAWNLHIPVYEGGRKAGG